MAAKRSVSKRKTETEMDVNFETPKMDMTDSGSSTGMSSVSESKKFPKWLLVVALVIGGLGLWFWRTNTWPVVAVVGTRPITRFEIEKSLFEQYGQATIDGLITQYQIEEQLNKMGVSVDEAAVTARIEEVKKSLGPGQDLDTELASRGLDMNKFKNLISLQLRLNKAVEGKASVSAEQVAAYVKENDQFLTGKTPEEKRAEAEEALKQDAANSEIEKWVAEAQKQISVWRLYPEPTLPAGASGVGQ